MLSCSAYFRRAIRNLLSDVPPTNATSSRSQHVQPLTFLFPQQSRAHSTLQALRKGHHRQAIKKALAKSQSDRARLTNTKRRNGPLPGEVRDVLARENNRRHLLIERDSVSSSTQFQLQWLQDPLKLANAVNDRLRIGADQEALELIRGSEKARHVHGEQKAALPDNVVSWNHVMEYYMYKGDIREALKVYNEMKKRGHRPEAHTYTILLKGFAQNVKKTNAVRDAVSVYNSIFAPNSAVTPNTIHTNAVINVCARGGDMDNLWSVAGKLPERGPGAPDNITYTSILNAIRTDAEKRTRFLWTDNSKASEKIIDTAVRDGEKLWMDVNRRWRAGNFRIDEPLACAMGRLLLLGRTPTTWNNIFLLVEQTMRVPRYERSESSELSNSETIHVTESTKVVNFEPNTKGTSLAKPQVSVYARPSGNTLSMVLQASILTRNLPAGKYYWDLLTSTDGNYRISFDPDNLAMYLRLLRVSRSSKTARDLLYQDFTEDQATGFLSRSNFIIAMSTCVRDKNNPNAFDNATDIFEKMQQRLPSLDAKVMDMYLEIAVVTTPGLGHKEGRFNPDPQTNNAMRVLARFEAFVPEIKHLLTSKLREEQYEDLPNRRRKKLKDPRDAPDRVYQSIHDLSSFLKALIGVYDRLLAQKSLPENTRNDYTLRKRRTVGFITKMTTEPTRREKMTNYSERETGVMQFENQERTADERARGIKGPQKFHSKPSQRAADSGNSRRDHGQELYQEGWGGDFAISGKQQGVHSASDFISMEP